MDVRCDRCQTEYELDETHLTEAGIAVKCTNCGNVFKVRRGGTGVYTPPLIAMARPREWHVRRADGQTLTLRDLTELQKAVVERRVSDEDSVSLSGESWHTLGSMPELASFFEVVRAATAAIAGRTSTAPLGLSVGSSPAAAPAPSPVAAWSRNLTPVWGDGPTALGAPSAAPAEPAWAASGPAADPELDEMLEREDLQSIKTGSSAPWLILLLLLVGGGGAYYYLRILPHRSASNAIVVPAEQPTAVPPPPTPLPEPAVVPAPAPVAVAAVPPAAPPVALPPPPPVPAVAEAPAAALPMAKDTANAAAASGNRPPSGRSFDFYLQQGHRLLDSKPAQALAMFQKAAEAEPQSPEPDSGRGLAYANLENLNEAISAFQEALRKSSEFTEAIMGLAEVYRRQGNHQKALALYQRYLDLTPDGADAPVARVQIEQLRALAPPVPIVAPAAEPTPPPPPPPPPPPSIVEEKPAEPVPTAPPPVVVPDPAPPTP